MVSTPDACTSMRLDAIASVVLGRSKEMRAGLSIVNDMGCGAGPDRRMVICNCCPGRGCTSTDCNAGWSALRAGAAGTRPSPAASASEAAAPRRRFIRLDECILRLPAGSLFVQAERGGALHVPAEAVRNDFNETDLGWGDVGDLAFRLPHVIAGGDAMHEPVLGLYQAEHIAAEAQRADHLQGVERVLLEELATAFLIGAHAGKPRARARAARQERRAQILRRVQEGLVRLDLRQRLDAPARLLLGVLDEAREVVVGARAGGEHSVAAGEHHAQQPQSTSIGEVSHVQAPRSQRSLAHPAGFPRWVTSFFLSASLAAISSSSM